VAGNLAAMEGIKLLAGMGETMAGKLLTYNLRHMEFRTVAIRRRPDCPICGSIRSRSSRP
jgi:bacteriocin biosynthesis cyclodehydratase domain-containing protein